MQLELYYFLIYITSLYEIYMYFCREEASLFTQSQDTADLNWICYMYVKSIYRTSAVTHGSEAVLYKIEHS